MARPPFPSAAPAASSANILQKQSAESRGRGAPVSLGNQKQSSSQTLLCLCLLLLTTWERREAAAHPSESPSAAGDSFKPEEPNKNIIFFFGIEKCKERELASVIASVISEAAQQTRSMKAREDSAKNEANKQEESVELRVSASPGEPRIRGTARTSTVYILQQESLSAFRTGPHQPSLCEIDSVTLHHLNCQMISLKQCNTFIDPDILKEMAQNTECVDLVDFDYKASPLGAWESFSSEGKSILSLMAKNSLKELPNDPHLLAGEQWELLEGVGVEAQKAWRSTRGGAGTVREQPLNTIAIIDFGFNMQHEDLVESWWRNANLVNPKLSEWPDNCFDGIDNDRNGYIDDCLGYSFADRSGDFAAFSGEHGTAVASACCASTNNSRGVASLGWNLRPMALKIDGSYSQIAEALNYAADKMVAVVNLSFGGPPSAALRAALAVAAARDMSLIVAAGNHHVDFASVIKGRKMPRKALKGFPAGYGDLFSNLVAVAAIGSNGRPAKFTNFDSSENPKIHVLAPGERILTCSDTGVKDYVRVSGTSFATPIVAAVAGLIRYESPELSAKEVKQVLIHSCYQTPNFMLDRLAKCGGIISAAKALKNAGVLPKRN